MLGNGPQVLGNDNGPHVLGNGLHLLGIVSQFGIMSHSALCRIRGYVVRHYVLRHNVAFGLMSFGYVSFGVMSFGIMSVYGRVSQNFFQPL